MHKVELIHVTPNAEELVAYMARVSNPKNQDNKETAPKLIRYLIKHKHWSPFEMVNMCVEIRTTRSIAAQILRHRSFSFQEFSQRYSEVYSLPVLPRLREQDLINRQNSTNTLDPSIVDSLTDDIEQHYDNCMKLYHQLLDKGVAKECAREVLPLSTPTRMYMNGTLRSWLHYCDLRTSNGTQFEHKLIADEVQDIIMTQFPMVAAAMWG
jgi:thymidylate synthase (FAD)